VNKIRKLKKVIDSTDCSRIYTMYTKKLYMRTATNFSSSYSGDWGEMSSCKCDSCQRMKKKFKGKFNSRLTWKKDRSWKNFRRTQWKLNIIL